MDLTQELKEIILRSEIEKFTNKDEKIHQNANSMKPVTERTRRETTKDVLHR